MRVVHQRQGLTLGLEAGDDLARVHARLDQLERDAAMDRRELLREPHLTHPARANAFEELVRTDLPG